MVRGVWLYALLSLATPILCLFDNSEFVMILTPQTYEETVVASPLLWVTMWYNDSDPKSKKLVPLVEEAASATHKFGIRFGAVDAVAAPDLSKQVGNQATPGISFCAVPPVQNPYTKRLSRQSSVVNDASLISSAGVLKKLVSQQLLNLVQSVSNRPSSTSFVSLLQKGKNDGASHVALYFNKKTKASPLMKSIAMNFQSYKLAVGEVLGVDVTEQQTLASQLGVSRAPAFVLVSTDAVLPERTGSIVATKMDSKVSFEAIVEFINSTVHSPQIQDADVSTPGGASVRTFESSAKLRSAMMHGPEAWVILIVPSNQAFEEHEETLNTVAHKAQRQGKTSIAVLRCDRVNTTEVDSICEDALNEGVRFASVTARRSDSDATKAQTFHSSMKAAYVAASTSLVHGRVKQVDELDFQQEVARTVRAKKVPVVLLSSKTSAPPVLENVAEVVEGACEFLLISNPSTEFQASMSASQLPTLMLLAPMPDAEQPERIGFQAVMYDPAQIGKFSLSTIEAWIRAVLHQLGLEVPAAHADNEPTPARTAKEKAVPFEELHADNFASNCVETNTLCLIAFLNPVDDNSDRLEILSQLHENRSGYVVSWAASTCHPQFMQQFGVDAFALPALIAVKPAKGAFATFIGKFDRADIARFARSVASGRSQVRQLPPSTLLTPDSSSEDCAALRNALDEDGEDAGADTNDDADLAEFLRETAEAERVEQEAASAAAAVADINRDPCDDPNLNEWGQKECRAQATRQLELNAEKERLANEIRAKRKAAKKKRNSKRRRKSKSKPEL